MKKKNSLIKQLVIIILLVFSISFILLGVVLPKTLIPIAENEIYRHLSEPLKMLQSDFDKKIDTSEISYLYIFEDEIVTSDNLKDVIPVDNPIKIVKYIDDEYGKFTYKLKTYYYYTIKNNNVVKIALTDDTYIQQTKINILKANRQKKNCKRRMNWYDTQLWWNQSHRNL